MCILTDVFVTSIIGIEVFWGIGIVTTAVTSEINKEIIQLSF